MALALVLKEAGYEITALHVDHGLRPESAAEAQQVRRWMQAFEIPCFLLNISENLHHAPNLMAAAREARYRLIAGWCREWGINYVCTAHHGDDQAETFLMRLGRGSGIDGLAAIREQRDYEGVTVLRPFLRSRKSALRTYLAERAQLWIEDPTNLSDGYARNRIRTLLPLLEKEGITAGRLLQATEHLARATDCLNALASQWMEAHVTETPEHFLSMRITTFKALHEELGLRVMRFLLRRVAGDAHDEVRFDGLRLLVSDMRSAEGTFRTRTLHHCLIRQRREDFTLTPEKRFKIT